MSAGGDAGHALTDAALLDDKQENPPALVALAFHKGRLGLASLSLASGDFRVLEATAGHRAGHA